MQFRGTDATTRERKTYDVERESRKILKQIAKGKSLKKSFIENYVLK